MPSKKVCAKKFKAGTKAYKDCVNYKVYDKNEVLGMVKDSMGPKKKKPKFKGGKTGRNY